MKKFFVLLAASCCLLAACKKEEEPVLNGANGSAALSGAIDALYSVSPTQQVRFSKGNLQYKATTNTFRFAENQYDRIGSDNENISQYYAGWIDLFGWGTSGWDNGNLYYHPWDWDFDTDYELGCGYGPLPSREHDLVGEYANSDWGVYNAISNGGDKPGMWRTLTADEWDYVMTKRSGASQKYGVASIEGVNGMVLLPDSWTLPQGVTFNPGSAENEDKEYYARHNSWDHDQWKKMEQNGAVFLPAGGVREDYKQVDYVNDVGRYWSSSRVTGAQYSLYLEWCSFSLYFDSRSLLTKDYNNPRDYGRCVRLVADAD